ncbi:hypothetical protein CMI41_00575 [Candidatus Pacearchaeota archaeon]|nr:hypothetical protein [Candidatus Pacearchaeota archaeon]|tara:strand:- start:10814 stop:11134 length:321 start_codon:yes stop_codon:yes gene_type:complete
MDWQEVFHELKDKQENNEHWEAVSQVCREIRQEEEGLTLPQLGSMARYHKGAMFEREFGGDTRLSPLYVQHAVDVLLEAGLIARVGDGTGRYVSTDQKESEESQHP